MLNKYYGIAEPSALNVLIKDEDVPGALKSFLDSRTAAASKVPSSTSPTPTRTTNPQLRSLRRRVHCHLTCRLEWILDSPVKILCEKPRQNYPRCEQVCGCYVRRFSDGGIAVSVKTEKRVVYWNIRRRRHHGKYEGGWP
jgi:hypothetical protein